MIMATADSVKAKIQGLINSANATTEQNDTTLTDAVNHLKEGYGQGGGDNYYDTFWDAYQENGNVSSYLNRFSGKGWTNETFKPKYDIRPNGGSMTSCFYSSAINGDLVEILAKCGVVLDTSKATNFNSAFNSTVFTRIGTIDTTGATSNGALSQAFSASLSLKKIDKLILKSDGSQTFNGTFDRCSALEEIEIDGVIGQSGLNMSACTKLSKASIESIINALSTTTSGLTVTFSQTAVDNIVATEGTGWWEALVASRPKWDIRLE
jgi:hypothetical protein